MPVPINIGDLSIAAGSNSPAGTDNPSEGDNYIRALSSFIAQIRDRVNGVSGNITPLTITVSGVSSLAGITGSPSFSVAPVLTVGANFSNVAQAGATTLDWYQEGSFTPTAVGASVAGTASYILQRGRYTRIGNRVLFDLAVSWGTHTGSGDLRIGGLPFVASQINTSVVAVPDLTSLNFDAWTIDLQAGNNYMRMQGRNQNTGSNAIKQIGNGETWRISGHYEV